MAFFALIFPYVPIMATLSAPYFSVTYLITSTRLRSSKSMSTSGMETRSGLRNRSKIRPCGIGSRSVMPMAYATIEPAAEPRPGPTAMPCFLAHMMKSATTRKYPGNPIWMMTSISYSTCFCRSSGTPPGKRRFIPRRTSSLNQVTSVNPSGISNFGMRFFASNM